MASNTVSRSRSQSDPNLLPFRYALKAYIEQEKLKIPVLPDVVARVLELINHPTVDANTLARLIHKDQALAGYVLRVSNSPMYAGSKEILTLRQAIARIGARTLGRIAMSITMQGKVFKSKLYQQEMSVIWRQSLASGALAQDIGNMLKNRSETLYLCGLLHSVGKPVILQALEELKTEFKMDLTFEGGIVLVHEFHQDVGGRVAEQWKLPEAVREAALHYKDPSSSSNYRTEVNITYIAHQISGFLDKEPDEEEIVALATEPSVAELKLKETDIRLLIGRLEKIRELLKAITI